MMNNTPAMPSFFEPLLALQYSAADVGRILQGCGVQRATTLRANALLSNRDEVAAALDAAGISWTGVDWYDDAFVLEGATERDIGSMDIYETGKVYLQSLSSMIPALVLDAKPGEDICDMCAAPGGKTTQIAALTSGKAPICACEMHAPRAEKLEFNLRRQGAVTVNVMRTDARRLDDFFSFDRILLDAPCSGSGTLRASDSKLHKRFTPELVKKSNKAQRALIAKALNLLKPGGTLVYSTCSVLASENEDIVRKALDSAPKGKAFELMPIEIEGSDSMPALPTSLEGALALCPTGLYEGFFVSKIMRTK